MNINELLYGDPAEVAESLHHANGVTQKDITPALTNALRCIAWLQQDVARLRAQVDALEARLSGSGQA